MDFQAVPYVSNIKTGARTSSSIVLGLNAGRANHTPATRGCSRHAVDTCSSSCITSFGRQKPPNPAGACSNAGCMESKRCTLVTGLRQHTRDSRSISMHQTLEVSERLLAQQLTSQLQGCSQTHWRLQIFVLNLLRR